MNYELDELGLTDTNTSDNDPTTTLGSSEYERELIEKYKKFTVPVSPEIGTHVVVYRSGRDGVTLRVHQGGGWSASYLSHEQALAVIGRLYEALITDVEQK